MKTISVVIPTYNHYDLLHQCLWDLYKHCRDSLLEVLIVNDASTDDVFYEGLRWWKSQEMLPIKELRLEENHRFLRASNKGMMKASGDILVLLSNDVRVYKDVCKDIAEIISRDENVLVGGRFLDFKTGWNNFREKTFYYLEGWLLACTKNVWDVLGGFDDRYAPNDYEDVDLSATAVSKGISLVIVSDSHSVEHLGAQSIGYSLERETITKANREKFKEKWNVTDE